MTDLNYMGYEQCSQCRFDHLCWSLGSFLWENGNVPNDCKQFTPFEEESE